MGEKEEENEKKVKKLFRFYYTMTHTVRRVEGNQKIYKLFVEPFFCSFAF